MSIIKDQLDLAEKLYKPDGKPLNLKELFGFIYTLKKERDAFESAQTSQIERSYHEKEKRWQEMQIN